MVGGLAASGRLPESAGLGATLGARCGGESRDQDEGSKAEGKLRMAMEWHFLPLGMMWRHSRGIPGPSPLPPPPPPPFCQ